MISDEDAKDFFRSQLGKPCAFGGQNLSLQIIRGKRPRHWKDAHPGGCSRHFSVFNNFSVIPEYCFNCYKVTVLPRTVLEHFKLLMTFANLELQNDNTRKCMVETRDEFTGTYKGIVYCRGVDEGEKTQEAIIVAINNSIGPDIPVTLKRGCSEFAAAYPAFSPSEPDAVWMEYNPDWKVHEEFVDSNSVFNTTVPSALTFDNSAYSPAEIFAMRYWLSYAATIGDTSYLKITGFPLPPLPELKRPPFSPINTPS